MRALITNESLVLGLDLGNSLNRGEGERTRSHTRVAEIPKKKVTAHT